MGFGEAGAEWGHAQASPVRCQCDCDGVDRTFDKHRGRGRVAGDDVELVTLVEEGCFGGVEVLGAMLVGFGVVGIAAGYEPQDLAFVIDWEDEAVAESIDDAPGGGDLGDSSGEHFVVGDPVFVEVRMSAFQLSGA